MTSLFNGVKYSYKELGRGPKKSLGQQTGQFYNLELGDAEAKQHPLRVIHILAPRPMNTYSYIAKREKQSAATEAERRI